MNRRSFLSIIAGSSGSCLIPAAIARRIREVCIGASQPLILAPERFSFNLYAQESCGHYLLHLGNPEIEPELPTLREFIESRSCDTDDDESLREYLIDWRSYDEDSDEVLKDAIEDLKSELDNPIDGHELGQWEDWDCELQEGTLPKAYHYLSNLPLDDGSSCSGFDLGSLSFIQGDHPGSNLTYVEADNLAAIASLQHRLNKLETGARILVD
jgi:hypothetical protein